MTNTRFSRSIGRKLYDKPRLWSEDGESKVRHENYWELFADLVMVAAASAVADVMMERRHPSGLIEFALLYSAVLHSWLLYTHHYTSRFMDSSLVHSLILLLFLFGMAVSVVNASSETKQMFSIAIIWQRCSLLAMFIPVYSFIPRARPFVVAFSTLTGCTIVCFVVSALSVRYTCTAWSVAALLDFMTEFVMVYTLRGSDYISCDVAHTDELMGLLVQLMLGEAVISSTMTYREHAANPDFDVTGEYYVVLALSFVLVFMFSLLFFHIEPDPAYHAFRRSRVTGCVLLSLNKLLGLGLLSIGVAIKWIVQDVADEKPRIDNFSANLLAIGLGSSMLLLLAMRACHFAGRWPRESDSPQIRRLVLCWWGAFGGSCLLPFLVDRYKAFIPTLAQHSGIVFMLCVVDSWFAQRLQSLLPAEEEEEIVSWTATHAGYDALSST